MMVTSASNIPHCSYSPFPIINKQIYPQSWGNGNPSLSLKQATKPSSCTFSNEPQIAFIDAEEKRRFKWVEIGPGITEEQRQAIDKLPFKMTKRCKALMKQIICFNPEKGSLEDLLGAWVNVMKPRRADWLVVLKELKITEHPLYFQVWFIFPPFLKWFSARTLLMGLLCFVLLGLRIIV